MQHTIEELNYHDDARVRALDERDPFEIVSERGMKLVVRLDDGIVEMLLDDELRPSDFDGVLEVEFKYDVCPLCQGQGTHTDPSIDCCGLTSEDFDEDPDFRENYASGVYDVTCNRCGGKRVVPVVKLPEDVQKVVDSWHADLADMRRMERAERRMGA